jgi:hypothetical protein
MEVSMKKYFMKQCTLEKHKSDRTIKTVSWIPEKFAELGRIVDIKQDGKWSKGWKVGNINPMKQFNTTMAERSQDYKNTRKASDI